MSRKKNPLTRQDPAAQENQARTPQKCIEPSKHSWERVGVRGYVNLFECRFCDMKYESASED